MGKNRILGSMGPALPEACNAGLYGLLLFPCYFPFPIVGPLISCCFPITENKQAHNKKLIGNPVANKEPLGYLLGKTGQKGGGSGCFRFYFLLVEI